MENILALIDVLQTTIKAVTGSPILLGSILLGLTVGHFEKKCR